MDPSRIAHGWSETPNGWESLDTHELKLPTLEEEIPRDILEKHVDAILVCAGGVDETGQVNEWARRRLAAAAHIFEYHRERAVRNLFRRRRRSSNNLQALTDDAAQDSPSASGCSSASASDNEDNNNNNNNNNNNMNGNGNDSDLKSRLAKKRNASSMTMAEQEEAIKHVVPYIVCLGGGTYHKPNYINPKGFPVHESSACADYLLSLGIDGRHILKEWSSYDTIANAFFGLTNHVLPRSWKRFMVITSDFHMPRTRAIFEWVFNLEDLPFRSEMFFYSVTDGGIDNDLIKLRAEREKSSLASLLRTRQSIRSFGEFHDWFFMDHKAYAVQHSVVSPAQNSENLDPSTLRTY